MSGELSRMNKPEFDFISYFKGHRRASGWFSDRCGNVRRHFSGDFVGTVNELGDFVLDESLVYSDGLTEHRIWTVQVSDSGDFRAESDSLIGPAVGAIRGNVLNMRYDMNVLLAPEKTRTFSMDDFMYLQPDGSLHNITYVRKFGIRIGTVSTQYFRPAGEDT